MAHAPDSQHTDCEAIVDVEVLSSSIDEASRRRVDPESREQRDEEIGENLRGKTEGGTSGDFADRGEGNGHSP